MTEINWGALAEPFPDNEVKQRPGPGGRSLSYVDARAVAQRLDDVLTPAGWNFRASVELAGFVKGTLTIGESVREDFGYPNSDDDAEPYKSAVSDALKRCAVLFGIGRHLYDDNKNGHRPAQNGSGRPQPPRLAPVAVQRPVAVPDDPYGATLSDTDEGRARSMGGDPAGNDCPEHGIAWVGEYGDRYHKKPEGGYCRTAPGNVSKPARAR